MTTPDPILAHYAQQQAGLLATGIGERVPWINESRRRGLEKFHHLGFPTNRDEDWKYTRVSAIEKRAFVRASDGPPAALDTEYGICSHRAGRLVFVDGVHAPTASAVHGLPEGVSLLTLEEGFAADPGGIQAHLSRHENDAKNGFSALNAAFLDRGAVLKIAAGVQLDAPIELLFVATGSTEDQVSHPRIFIEAQTQSRVNVVETYRGIGPAAYLTNVATDITAAQGSQVTHCKVQLEGDAGYHVSTLRARLAQDARLSSTSISLGARLARSDIDVRLEGHGSACVLDGLMLARARQHVDYHTRVDHLVSDTSSDEYYKGIFDDRSRGVFNGRVYVHPGADRTDAQQQNRNLLLSKNAEIDTKPQLEIYADEVKCSHGATVGQLDDNMLFYLRSRGLTEEVSRSILTYGFAREVVDRIADPNLRQSVAEHVLVRLPGADQLGDLGA